MIYDMAKVLSEIEETSDEWFIGDFCLVTVPKLVLGKQVQVNAGSKILGKETVTIGDGSVVSYDVLILTSSDSPDPPNRRHNDFARESERKVLSAPITIGKECFIGAKSILMPGVTLPDNTVIPAFSYVTMVEEKLRVHNVKNAYKAIRILAHKKKRKVKTCQTMTNPPMYQ